MDFTTTDIEEIETLAAQGYVAKAIALVFDVKPNLFELWCLDETHPVGKAYQRGRLEINRQKNVRLLEKMESGSETAIQIHDKKAKEQAFLDIKNDIFSGFDE